MKCTRCAGAARILSVALTALLVVLAVGGCAMLGRSDAGYDRYALEEAGAFAPEPAPSAEGGTLRAADESLVTADVASVDQTAPPPAEPAPERKRVFSADLELVVTSVEDSRLQVIATVERAGGYIESSRSDFLVVRVPAAQFDSVLSRIEAAGDVRSRSVRTADVTDQFFDLQRRLEITTASRDRLLDLLEQTEDAEERVAILRDIRRLTEEIEQLRSSLESLDQLVRFSRITVQLVSRIQVSTIGQLEIPFAWIRDLSPVSSSSGEAGADIEIEPDDAFAVFSSGRLIRAEAADGTQFRAGAVSNNPAGSAEFWQQALIFHLSPFYKAAFPGDAGPYRGVLFESRDSDPFSYLVAVLDHDDELIVVEAFFPDSNARDARLQGILDSLEGGE